MVGGRVSEERAVEAAAADAWKLLGSLQLPKVVKEALPTVIDKINVVEGDGGPGTVLHVFYVPGVVPGLTSYKEKFTVLDNEKRVKVVEVVEGGYLDLGFTLYRTTFEVIEKGGNSCSPSTTIKITVEYELKDGLGDDEVEAAKKRVSIVPLMRVMEYAASNYLHKN